MTLVQLPQCTFACIFPAPLCAACCGLVMHRSSNRCNPSYFTRPKSNFPHPLQCESSCLCSLSQRCRGWPVGCRAPRSHRPQSGNEYKVVEARHCKIYLFPNHGERQQYHAASDYLPHCVVTRPQQRSGLCNKTPTSIPTPRPLPHSTSQATSRSDPTPNACVGAATAPAIRERAHVILLLDLVHPSRLTPARSSWPGFCASQRPKSARSARLQSQSAGMTVLPWE